MSTTATGVQPELNPVEASFGHLALDESPDADRAATAQNDEGGAGAAAEETTESADSETSLEEAPAEETAAEGAEEELEAAESEAEDEPADYTDLLPQELQMEYSEELYAKTAEKLGVPTEQLNEPWVKKMVREAIESSILKKNMSELETTAAAEEDESGKTASTAEQTEEAPQYTPAQLMEAATEFVRPLVTKEGAQAYTEAQGKAWSELAKAQESGDEQAVAAAQQAITESQMAFLTMALTKIMPQMLGRMLENLPQETWRNVVGGELGRRDSERQMHIDARAALMKDQNYAADLQRFIKSGELLRYIQQNPELLQKQFKTKDGKPLGPLENLQAQYRAAIHAIRGASRRNPADLVRKGIEAGKRQQQQMQNRKTLARTAPGRSTGQIRTAPDASKEMATRYKDFSEGDNPLGKFLDAAMPQK